MNDLIRNSNLYGCQLTNKGASFRIYSEKAAIMLLEVYQRIKDTLPTAKVQIKRKECQLEHVFEIELEGIQEGMAYVWRKIEENGAYSPTILDPYGKAVEFYNGEWRNIIVHSEISKTTRPRIPWQNTIIYELHVGYFTSNQNSQLIEAYRGTFTGILEKLSYLKELGVTTLELLPIFKWNANTLKNHHPDTGEVLQDQWGYNPIAFFAIEEQYSVSKTSTGALKEFRNFVECIHQNGLEIILDVVYNHTGEGGEDGGSFHFKYLGKRTYYRLDSQGQYLNCSGTGNTLNTSHKIVKKLILDSLRYWVQEIGVDGFRFDLASILGQDEEGRWLKESLLNEIAEDPIISKVKLISESWDAKGSYDVGRMPYAFREWSDYFRDTMRRFIKGDQGNIKSVADCLQGKEIYFTNNYKTDEHTIHFITAHDGFTMWDLLCYNTKHNWENGEENRDGNNANYSYNWGIEGESDDPLVSKIRKRCMKNFICLLFVSRGVPMLLMGDEVARTQRGNNNAYCQNSESVWMDWRREETYREILLFTKKMIRLRKEIKYLSTKELSLYEITWHGVQYGNPDWSYYSRSIAWHIKGPEESFYIIANSYHDALRFELPPSKNQWLRIVDTTLEEEKDIELKGIVIEGSHYLVDAYSIIICREDKAPVSYKKS